MTNNMTNIRAFKDACSDFGIQFRDTDDRRRIEMLVHYKVNGKTVLYNKIQTDFIHSVNCCKIDIGNYENLNIHCEASTEWQDFKYIRETKLLLVTGASRTFGHKYAIEIAMPQ